MVLAEDFGICMTPVAGVFEPAIRKRQPGLGLSLYGTN